jgi:Base plate wedge protein 53
MSLFFRPYPTVRYRIPGRKESIAVTDITRRFALSNFFKNAAVNFDEYYVQDGERPDTVAYDYYGDETFDWLVLITNEMKDPYFDWVLGYEELNLYIKQKYGSVSVAHQTVHHYEKIIQPAREVNTAQGRQLLPEKTLVVDYATYANLIATNRKSVSIFDYETDLNDTRRHIYLLDLNYLGIVKTQHPYIFDEGVFLR